MTVSSFQKKRELTDNFADKKEMSAGNKEKAADGSLESLDKTEDPTGDRKEEKPELEVEDEKLGEGKNEESLGVAESPGAMSSEQEITVGNLTAAATGEEIPKLDTVDTKKSSRESNETEINVHEVENSLSKVEDDKSKNIVDVESQEIRVVQEVKKEDEESFRFSASVASLWIPSIVGNQKKKIFLKAGEDKSCAGFPSSNEIFQESQA